MKTALAAALAAAPVCNALAASAVPAPAPLAPAAKREACLMRPDADFAYLHDNAVFAFRGRLFAAWYNCPQGEMIGTSVIRGKWSDDKGATWSDVKLFAGGDDGFMRVPPAFGTDGESLYLFASRMAGVDIVRDCEIYRWDAAAEKFESAGLMGFAFLPNTAMTRRTDGRWMIGGRRNEKGRGDQPLRPCIAVSETASVTGKWTFRDIAEETIPGEGDAKWGCPEVALLADGRELTAFVRIQDRGREGGLGHRVFTSVDEGETWSLAPSLPFALEPAKPAAGMLSDGRRYLVANPRAEGRNALVIWLAEKGAKDFSKAYYLQKGASEATGCGFEWCYPSVIEYEGELYVIASTCTGVKVKNSSGLTIVKVGAL